MSRPMSGMIFDSVPPDEPRPPSTPFLRRGQRATFIEPAGAPYRRTRGRDRPDRDLEALGSVPGRERELAERTLAERFLRLAEVPPRRGGTRAKWTRERMHRCT